MKSTLHIFVGGVDNNDYVGIHELARSGGTSRWSSTKNAVVGDRVLLYVVRPHSAIIAKATVVKSAWAGEPGDWKYLVRIGNVQLLKSRVTIAKLKSLFPQWGWLTQPRSKATVPYEIADRLWKLAHEKLSIDSTTILPKGAGFGDYETNKLVERSAIRKVQSYLKRKGYVVISREREKVGFDLEASKGVSVLHIEVKGVTGSKLQFPITSQEVERAKKDPAFRLYVVLNAMSKQSKLSIFTGRKFIRTFDLRTISYLANKNK